MKVLWEFQNTINKHFTNLVAQMVKNVPAMHKTQVWTLGQEDPLEKEMATHSSILAWGIPGRVEPGGLQSIGSERAGYDWVTNTDDHFVYSKLIIHHLFIVSSFKKLRFLFFYPKSSSILASINTLILLAYLNCGA